MFEVFEKNPLYLGQQCGNRRIIVSFCTVLAVVLTVSAVMASSDGSDAADTLDSGQDGNISWTLTSDHVLTFTSDVEDTVMDSYGASWLRCSSDAVSVVIGANISSVGYGAFAGFTALEDVSFGADVTTIGIAAFRGCTSLESIVIPDTVTTLEVDEYANEGIFQGCTNLKDVVIGSSVTCIGAHTFEGCSSLQTVTINATDFTADHPFSKESTGAEGFTAAIGDGVTAIPATLFADSGLTQVTIGRSVEEVGAHAFASCPGLLSFDVDPENAHLTVLDGVLYDADVTSILGFPAGKTGTYEVPSSITDIRGVFSGCSGLERIVLNEGFTELHDGTFDGCINLREVVINSDIVAVDHANNIDSMGQQEYGDIFGNAGTASETFRVVFADGVRIVDSHILDNSAVTEVYFGRDVASISVGGFDTCARLSVFNVSGDNAVYSSAGGMLLSEDGGTLIAYPRTAIELDIPESVETIGSNAFAGGRLVFADIPQGVKAVGEDAFLNCRSLGSVLIPESVETIGAYAFTGCVHLYEVINLGDHLLGSFYEVGADHTKRVTYVYCEPGVSVEDGFVFGTFDGTTYLLSYVGDSADIVLPMTLGGSGYVVADYAFAGLPLRSVDMSNVTAVGGFVFSGCESIERVTFGYGLTDVSPNFGAFGQIRFLNEGWDHLTAAEQLAGRVFEGTYNSMMLLSTHTAVFITEGGEEIRIPFAEGDAAINEPDAAPEGYRSVWSDYVLGDVDIEIRQTLVPLVSTVSFEANGGTGTMDDVTVSGDEAFSPVCTFAAPGGRVFAGWSADGSEWPAALPLKITKDAVLAPIWKDAGQLWETVNVDGKTVAMELRTAGEPLSVPASLIPPGFAAVWAVDGEEVADGQYAAADRDYVLSADLVLERFVCVQRYVDVDSGAEVRAEDTVIRSYGDIVDPDAPEIEGFTFAEKTPGYILRRDTDANVTTFSYGRNMYDIVFMLDGAVYQRSDMWYGDIITSPPAPSKPPTETIEYIFLGWEGLGQDTVVTGDMTFTASFDQSVRHYSVVFSYAQGGLVEFSLEYMEDIPAVDDPPAYTISPYMYTFTGWSPDPSSASVTDNLLFVAQYEESTITHTLTLYRWDGSLYGSYTLEEGEEFDLPVDTKVNPETGGDFPFIGWGDGTDVYYQYDEQNPEYSLEGFRICVTDSTTLYAMFGEEYTYDAYIGDDSYPYATGRYGETVPTPEAPRKEPTETTVYVFDHWDGYTEGMTFPKHDLCFTPQYAEVTRMYSVTYHANGGTFAEFSVPYDSVIPVPEGIPPCSDSHGLVIFDYWLVTARFGEGAPLDPGMHVTRNISVEAEYAYNPNIHTVTFMLHDGPFQTIEVGHGYPLPEAVSTSYVWMDETTVYTFSGWDYEGLPATVEEDMVVEAVYTSETRYYGVELNYMGLPGMESLTTEMTYDSWYELPECEEWVFTDTRNYHLNSVSAITYTDDGSVTPDIIDGKVNVIGHTMITIHYANLAAYKLYTFNDGTLEIYGHGAMEIEYSYLVPWDSFKDSITRVVIGDYVTSVGSGFFSDCANLEEVVIGGAVDSISSGAFSGCESLKEVSIPATVTSIGAGAFWGCTSLERFIVEEGNTAYSSPNGELVELSTGTLLAYPQASGATEYTTPSGVRAMAAGVFSGNTVLESITFGDSMESVPERAFSGCTSLRYVGFPAHGMEIGAYAFEGCTSLDTVDLGGLTALPEGMFKGCVSLGPTLDLEGIVSIGASAFEGCTGIEVLTIPDTVESVGEEAFRLCDYYQLILESPLGGDIDSFRGRFFSPRLFEIVNRSGVDMQDEFRSIFGLNLRPANYTTGDSCIGTFGDWLYGIVDGGYYVLDYVGEEPFTELPESLDGHGYAVCDGAVPEISGIEVFVIPDGVTSIGENNFCGSGTLNEIVIGKSFEYFGTTAFQGFRILKVTVNSESESFYPYIGGYQLCSRYGGEFNHPYGTPITGHTFSLKTINQQEKLCVNEIFLYFYLEGELYEKLSFPFIATGIIVEYPKVEVPEMTVDTVYYFEGWPESNMGAPMFEDCVFNGTIKSRDRLYWVTVFDENTVLFDRHDLRYGDTVDVSVPVREPTAEVTYTFSRWATYDGAVYTMPFNVTEDALIYAFFEEGARPYDVDFLDDDGTLIERTTQGYGARIVLPDNPRSKEVGSVTMIFSGWEGYSAGMTVTGAATFRAMYMPAVAPAEDGSGNVVFTTTETRAPISGESISRIIEELGDDTEQTMAVSVGSFTVEFDNASLRSLKPEDATLSVESVGTDVLPDEVKERIGDSTVIDISFGANTNFGGNVKVTVPYTLKAGEDPANVTVYYLRDGGQLERMSCIYQSGAVTFTTTHFSTYILTYEVPAEDPVDDDSTSGGSGDSFPVMYIAVAGVLVALCAAVGIVVMRRR